MQEQIKPILAREMHKYVLGLLGVWVLFSITFAISCVRVSQDKKFADVRSHVKSMTLEGEWEHLSNKSLEAQSVANNFSTKAVSRGTTDNNSQLLGVADGSQHTQAVNTTSQTEVISDRLRIRGLNRKLYEQVAKYWQPRQKLFERKLVYQVSMSQDGVIVSYKPVNQAASDYVQDTPLSDWSKGNSPDNAPQQDLVDFEVVFTRQGILEVTPWDGWKQN